MSLSISTTAAEVLDKVEEKGVGVIVSGRRVRSVVTPVIPIATLVVNLTATGTVRREK